MGLTTLLPLERGLTIAEALTASAIAGFVVFALELPTSGFADALGRRPVYIAAAVVNVAASSVYLWAQAFWAFALAAVLTGIFRALDSGPLEAWYVDTVHAHSPGADVDRGLSLQGMFLGAGIAGGALVSGGLVWWHPLTSRPALFLPFALAVALNIGHVLVVITLLREPTQHVDTTALQRAVRSATEAPAVVRDGLRLLRTNRILRGVIAVEVFWSVAMVVFETFQPIRLAELVGGEARAGAIMGPVAAAGWGVFAGGSALAGALSPGSASSGPRSCPASSTASAPSSWAWWPGPSPSSRHTS